MISKKKVGLGVGIFFLGVLGLFALYTWASLSWAYSSGERAGFVQKISKKGWLCKTWEGEMVLSSMPGAIPEKFFFTVRDEAVAKQISDNIGTRMTLNYTQHVGVPSSCFGETAYFIEKISPPAKVSK